MSFVTGTATELLYASTHVGIVKASFTTEFNVNDATTMGVVAHIPPDFWLPNSAQIGRGIRIVARGILSTNTVTNTYTWTIRGLGTGSTPNITTNPILLGSAAITCAASITNAYWELQGDVILTAMGAAGNNSTIQGVGSIACSAFTTAGANSAYVCPVYGGGATPGTTATVDTSVVNYINVNIACSASAAANSVTLQQLLVWGLN